MGPDQSSIGAQAVFAQEPLQGAKCAQRGGDGAVGIAVGTGREDIEVRQPVQLCRRGRYLGPIQKLADLSFKHSCLTPEGILVLLPVPG